MLNTNINTNITGISTIEGKQVVYMTASVPQNGGNSNMSKTITDNVLYAQNRAECRRDMSDFEDKVFEIEDNIAGGNVNESI